MPLTRSIPTLYYGYADYVASVTGLSICMLNDNDDTTERERERDNGQSNGKVEDTLIVDKDTKQRQ